MLIGILVFSITAIFCTSPIWIYKYRTAKRNIKISFPEIFSLVLYRCQSSLFLDEVAKFQQNNLPYTIAEITAHWASGGNLTNVREGLIYIRENNLEIDERLIFTLDLVGKKTVETIKKGPPYFN